MVDLAGAPLFGLPLPAIWFALVFFVLGMFLYLDGFDFGIGILFATRDDDAERDRLLAVIGPFWDGNEVWLVVFGGALFAAFPSVYANLFSRYYLLMFAILAALGLRGLAPEMYEEREDEQWRKYWGYSFIVGSALTPFLLGLFAVNWLTGAAGIVSLPGILGGLAVVALTVADGAAFLALKVDGELRADALDHGRRAVVAYVGLVAATLAAVYATTPELQGALLSPLVLLLVALSVALAGGYVVTTRREQYHAAFATAGGLVFGLVTVIAVTMYPAVDRAGELSVSEAIVSTLPLNLMTIMMAFMLPIVLSYFGVLYSVFSGPMEGETYG